MPLELVFEFVFSVMLRIFDKPIFSLIGLSLIVNLLCLPLYKRADAIQMAETEKQNKMSYWVKHIKKTFTGDERYMMLTTYYRQQNYRSIYAIRNSISLLLQIPFFMVAYRFLSNLDSIKGLSFWVIKDLGAPDQLFNIGNFTVNVLPILMTLLNVISAYIYLRGMPVSQKIQTYLLALVFLVLLYNSPSGLVIYWTCNQVFSLLKNVFMKLVKKRSTLAICISIAGVLIALFMWLSGRVVSGKRTVLVLLILVLCQLPLIFYYKNNRLHTEKKDIKPIGFLVVLLGEIYLTILIGVVVPLSVVSSSPAEFYEYSSTPFSIVVNNVCICAGIFLVWVNIFYYLMVTRMRNTFAYLIFALAGIFTLDFMLFGKKLGRISVNLIFFDDPVYSRTEILLNLLAVIVVIIGLIVVLKLLRRFVPYIYLVLIACALGLVITNSMSISATVKEAGIESVQQVQEVEPLFPLSKTGKNVVILTLDKAFGPYLPFIFNEIPQLYEQYTGFIYYPQTLSFGIATNLGAPAMYGGYEYTVEAINERSDETLIDKHNESVKMLPKLFADHGYRVSVSDIPYCNYMIPSDLSIYDDIDGVNAYFLRGKYSAQVVEGYSQYYDKQITRNFFYYSIFKCIPVVFQKTLYDNGNYYSTADGIYSNGWFLDAYAVLSLLPELTEITETDENTFLMFMNITAHENTILKRDDGYSLPTNREAEQIMNSFVEGEYEELNGIKMLMDTTLRVSHYDSAVAAMIKVGEWLEYLKENDVYDNTRIIINSDHGWKTQQFDYLMLNIEEPYYHQGIDVGRVNPLLMYKDFGSTGELVIDNTFMTNADSPYLAFNGLIDDPINPYTGNSLLKDNKNDGVNITYSANWEIEVNDGYKFNSNDGPWYHVSGDIFDADSWELIYSDEYDYNDFQSHDDSDMSDES